MMQIAFVIRDEVLDLEKNGIRMIQIDEATLREKLPLRKSDWYSEYLDFTIPFSSHAQRCKTGNTDSYTYVL